MGRSWRSRSWRVLFAVAANTQEGGMRTAQASRAFCSAAPRRDTELVGHIAIIFSHWRAFCEGAYCLAAAHR